MSVQNQEAIWRCLLWPYVQSLEHQRLYLLKYTSKISSMARYVSVYLFLSISTSKSLNLEPCLASTIPSESYNQNCEIQQVYPVPKHQSLEYHHYFVLEYIFKTHKWLSMFWPAHLCSSRDPKWERWKRMPGIVSSLRFKFFNSVKIAASLCYVAAIQSQHSKFSLKRPMSGVFFLSGENLRMFGICTAQNQ